MKVIFWVCLLGALYSYFIYPLLLQLIRRRTAIVADENDAPRVSLIIACRNEEKRLRAKIENALATIYSNREILVASDASDDSSDSIVESYAGAGVRLVRSPERRGKEHAQGLAIAAATGEILVFTDAGTDTPPESIGELVASFRDPRVGAVSSEDRFVGPDGKLVGEGAYVRYEMWLRQLESQRAGLVGLSGSFFAVRKSVLTSWDSTIPSDFACALRTVQAGMVAISNSKVHGIYKDIADPSREYGRKVRTAIRGMSAVVRLAEVLNPFRYGMFSFQVWSHKVMRWLVPWFLLGLFVVSWVLASAGLLYRLALWAQCAGYVAVLLAHWVPRLRNWTLVRLGYYFVQANLALASAGVQLLAGKRVVVWNPSPR
jgi:cellulose synthase/poly-beta-1,6-N-acetylglucosamine synthase-like glycosyltransferase